MKQVGMRNMCFFLLDLITIFGAILTGRQSGQKLHCLYGNAMTNNFSKINFMQVMKLLQC